MSDRIGGGSRGNVRSLQEAVRTMRVVSTERADGLADLSAAERARLELLAEELAEVVKGVPSEMDFFAFTVVGEPPRLWIDMTTHVGMGRDRRTYRFVKDTRLGRTVILETQDLDKMADCVTNYVAERVIERERAVEGDWIAARLRERIVPPGAAEPAPVASPVAPQRSVWPVVAAFMLGAGLGVAALIAFAWFRLGG